MFQVIKKYEVDQQKIPLFLCGRSFGGLIAFNMASSFVGQKMFKALGLITPYFRLHNEKLYDMTWKIRMIDMVLPYKPITQDWKNNDPEFARKWPFLVTDKQIIHDFTPRMAMCWLSE